VISTSDLKRGAMMELDGQIVQILSYEHQKIGRGSAQVRLKVKNIRTGAIFDTTAQAGSKWPRIRLDQRIVQYLYSEGDIHHFMDKESYEQFPLSPTQLGDAVNYLKDGMEFELLMYEDEPVTELGDGHRYDAVDGPPAPGAKPLGPFYELESSSPAIELKPGKSLEHLHRTIHLTGAESELDSVARVVFGVSLPNIKSALPR